MKVTSNINKIDIESNNKDSPVGKVSRCLNSNSTSLTLRGEVQIVFPSAPGIREVD